MKIIGNLFSKTSKQEASKDVMEIPRVIEPLINKVARDILESYKNKIISEPVTYIVPAIWGVQKKGELDNIQKEINQQITPVINKIFHFLRLNNLEKSQEFAIEYLIRGLVISRITYMGEVLKNRLVSAIHLNNQYSDTLVDIEPLGNT